MEASLARATKSRTGLTRHPDPETAALRDGTIVDFAAGEWGLATACFDQQRRYRYRLSRVWSPSNPGLVWVLLNPSTADASSVDPTLRRVLTFSRRWGFGAAVVVNLFALRAANPADLASVEDPTGPLNDAAIRGAVTSSDQIVVGWGNHGDVENRAASVMGYLATSGRTLLALGVTKIGQPRHPLYVPGSVQARPWREMVGTRWHQTR